MNDKQLGASDIVLHIWPGQWGLSSFDPQCLATVLYLQITIPGAFTVVECVDLDSSVSGQLPCLEHGQQQISSFASIVKYVAGLNKTEESSNPDSALTPKEAAQNTAWCAHVSSNVGNLVSYTLYSNQMNWESITHSTLVSLMPIPQRYYVPGKIRELYRPRLEAAGLWSLATVEMENEKKKEKPNGLWHHKKKENPKPTFLQAFEREKVLEKANATFAVFSRLLGGGTQFYQNRLTSLDILLAAHILLLVDPPYPNSFLKTHVSQSYPSLVSHARRVFETANSSSQVVKSSNSTKFYRALLPVTWSDLHSMSSRKSLRTPEDVEYDRMRWGFFGLALGSITAYFAIVGSPIRIQFQPS